MNDLFFMQEALKEAKFAFEKNEVPVGCVLVFKNEIIARSFNQVEEKKLVLYHAEMTCIRQATDFFKNWRLEDAILYSTLEPCLMCAGAMILSRIRKCVFGASDPRHGAFGSLLNAASIHPLHQLEVEGGLLAEESAALLKNFFTKRRHEKRKRII